MEELFGLVESIVFSDEEGGFVIARIKEPKKKDLSTVIGPMLGIHIGESLHCKGEWKLHQKFGYQFSVTSFETHIPTDELGIQRYLQSGMIKGIGPAYAEKIVKKFGVESLQIIDSSPHKLLTIPGIGEGRVEMILKCWEKQREIRSVMIFLRGHGVPPSFAQKIYKKYGEQSIEKMKENPYQIAQEIHGIGFKSADQIAQNLGVKKGDGKRIESGIEHLLWELSTQGHACYPRDQLLRLGEELLDSSPIGLHLESLKNKGRIIEEEGLVWIKPLFLAERGIAREIEERLIGSPCCLRNVDEQKALDWVQKQLDLDLAQEQKKAITSAVKEKVMILTGGPGTGKSTIINGILRICEKLTKKILLAAPTGRAAKRMGELTHRKAFTIHSLLEMDFIKGGFKRGRDHPLDCELIIVDEASMIDIQLMYALLKAIPTEARLLLVGDIDQLPSIGPGNVLRDLIDSGKIPLIKLTEIFRQAKGSLIIVNAHKIKEGEFPYLTQKGDCTFFEVETPDCILEKIVTLFKKDLSHLDWHSSVQVLSPMKRGIIGTENLNQTLQTILNPSAEPLIYMGRKFHKGDKVIQMRNNYQKEVFNGDIGVIEEIDLEEQFLRILFHGKEAFYEFAELDELMLAYAVSIHKYQGSECPCVIMPIHTTHFKLLCRNLLYTGITRGKKRVILIGTKKAIAIAIRNEEVQSRYTGLKRFMQQGPPALSAPY